MELLKVVFIITKADVGGAQKYVSDLAAHLDKNKFETKILWGGRDLKWLSNKIYPYALFFNDWLAVYELVRAFRKERPDIIHLNSSKAGVLGSFAAWLYKISVKKPPFKSNSKTPKIVFTAHGWVFNPTNYLGAPARWFYILLHKSAALFQHKIINVSEYDRALALRYKIAPAHKLITIHNGIDPNIPFLDKETARKDIIKKLKDSGFKISARGGSAFGGQDSRPWIGSIGRLTKEKDYGTFIEAAKMLPDAYFFIIGDGKEISNLKSKISNLKLTNRFFIVPPTGNDAQMLKAFDAFCMTSIKEGMPYVLLEAMAAGLPIVVTEAGGMPEAIKNNSNGMLVPLKDPEMLAQIISRLISGGRDSKNLGEKAVSAARDFFNAKKTIESTQKIYS